MMEVTTVFVNVTNSDGRPDIYFNVYYYGLFFTLTLINIPGNILVISTILRHRQLRQPGNYLLVSLAVSDLLMGCTYPIYNISHLEIPYVSGPLGEWPVCWTVLTCVLLAMSCSSFHIVSITIVRYIAIVYPLRYQAIVTDTCGLMGVVVTWLLAVTVTLGIYWPDQPETYKGLCRYELIYSPLHAWTLTGVQYAGPVIIMSGMYIRIIKIARQQAKVAAMEFDHHRQRLGDKTISVQVTEGVPENTPEASGTVHTVNGNKSVIMVTLLLGWFTISYIPMCVYLLTTVLCTTCEVDKYVRASIRILMYTNYMVNIFIYAGRLGDFRNCIKRDIKKWFRA